MIKPESRHYFSSCLRVDMWIFLPVLFLFTIRRWRSSSYSLLFSPPTFATSSSALPTMKKMTSNTRVTHDDSSLWLIFFRFRIEFILVPAIGLAFLVHHDFSSQELLWTFSIYLESVAIMPQLQMIAETGAAETITSHYLFFLGLYRLTIRENISADKWCYHSEHYTSSTGITDSPKKAS